MSSSQRTVELTKKNIVKIIAASPGINLDEELYAINWFDLKRPKLYEYYNQLAYPHLARVGGKVHFKGLVEEKLKGPKENDRQMLLIVRYPNADGFLSMLNNRMFLLKSVLRIKSVDYFTFGFTRRMGQEPAPLCEPVSYQGSASYLLHHFQTKDAAAQSIYEFEEIITQMGIRIHFAGYKAALIGRISAEKPLRTQRFLMDGLMVLESEDKEKLRALLADSSYQKLASSHISNNTSMINRLL